MISPYGPSIFYAQHFEGASPPSVLPELSFSLTLSGDTTYIHTERLKCKEGGHRTNRTYIRTERLTYKEGGTPDKRNIHTYIRKDYQRGDTGQNWTPDKT